MSMAMELSSRANNFAKIIAATECTGNPGAIVATKQAMQQIMAWLIECRESKNSVYIIGNGGSAAVASHAQIDFLNVAKLKAKVLHEPSVMTCMANDYGYENAFERLLETMLIPGDVVIAISSSGNSMNIRKGVKAAKQHGAKTITLSGFASDNPLRALGDLNLWLDSTDYGFVEVGHQFILHNLSDRFMALAKSIDVYCSELIE